MEKRYNVYFSGQILAGHDATAVRSALARLFNANESTLEKLFSGKAQLIKKGCDKATALKYKQAMEKAGAKPSIKLVQDSSGAPPGGAPPGEAPSSAPEPTPESSAAEPSAAEPSAAEKIAALAAAPDMGGFNSGTQPAAAESPGGQTDAETQPVTAAPERADSAAVSDGSLQLCPDGTEVLRPEERARPVTAEVDTSGLAVDASAERLSEPSAPAPPPPDTGHLAMGEAGEAIPNLPREGEPLDPDTDSLELSPEGTDFSDCKLPDAPSPELDLSEIALAPEGTEMLRPEERPRPPSPPPETGSIELAD